jgi:hypothetical protein
LACRHIRHKRAQNIRQALIPEMKNEAELNIVATVNNMQVSA